MGVRNPGNPGKYWEVLTQALAPTPNPLPTARPRPSEPNSHILVVSGCQDTSPTAPAGPGYGWLVPTCPLPMQCLGAPQPLVPAGQHPGSRLRPLHGQILPRCTAGVKGSFHSRCMAESGPNCGSRSINHSGSKHWWVPEDGVTALTWGHTVTAGGSRAEARVARGRTAKPFGEGELQDATLR